MIGVTITVYSSADVIEGCLASLFDQPEPVRVVLVDNASPDDSIARAAAFAAARGLRFRDVTAAEAAALAHGAPTEPSGEPPAPLTVVRAGRNLGYAGAVNLGLGVLAADPAVGLLWVLNPDCVVPPGTPAALRRAQAAAGRFAIMGSRILYHGTDLIHADGGRVSRWTGTCASVNRRAPAASPAPDPGRIDYVIGANMVVSREFLQTVGPMHEDYFLYYEEVDWALRRGALPLAYAPDAPVWHHGGTAIGTGRPDERPSAFSNYFNYRNRMRFMRRFHPWRLPVAWLVNLARIVRSLPRDDADRTLAALRGLHGLKPPAAVAARVGPEAAPLAFGRPSGPTRAATAAGV